MSRKRAGAYLSVLAALKERNYNAKSETNRKRMGGGEGGKWGRVWRGGEVVVGGRRKEVERRRGGREREQRGDGHAANEALQTLHRNLIS